MGTGASIVHRHPTHEPSGHRQRDEQPDGRTREQQSQWLRAWRSRDGRQQRRGHGGRHAVENSNATMPTASIVRCSGVEMTVILVDLHPDAVRIADPHRVPEVLIHDRVRLESGGPQPSVIASNGSSASKASSQVPTAVSPALCTANIPDAAGSSTQAPGRDIGPTSSPSAW
jgi:hypothetical protein